MNQSSARLTLQASSTTLEFDDGQRIILNVGPDDLATSVFRHAPPTPGELEHAIDIVEEALSAAQCTHADRGDLFTTFPPLLALPGLDKPPAVLTRDAVECLFERLTSRSHGMPVASAELPHRQDTAAALLILRECMHHLGFNRIGVA